MSPTSHRAYISWLHMGTAPGQVEGPHRSSPLGLTLQLLGKKQESSSWPAVLRHSEGQDGREGIEGGESRRDSPWTKMGAGLTFNSMMSLEIFLGL